MNNLRSILQSERRKKGLTIAQIAEQTKIPMRKIEAIERGDYESFDSEVYLKGFLRNYIKFLGLDIDKCMAIYRRERGIQNEQIISDHSGQGERPTFILTPAKVTISLVLFVLIALITFVGIQVNRIVKPPVLSVTAPVTGDAPGEYIYETDQQSISIGGIVETGSILKINGNTVNTNNLQEFQLDDFVLDSGNNKIIIEAENQFLKKNIITLNVFRTTEDTVQNDNSTSSSTSTDNVVQDFVTSFSAKVEILSEPSWIVISVDNVQQLATVAQPGDIFEYQPGQTITINTPRPHMMKITIEGEEITIPPNIDVTWKLVDGAPVQVN